MDQTPISVAEMRKIEQDAIASGRVSGLGLMERAGQGVVDAIFEMWPELDGPEQDPSHPGTAVPPAHSNRKKALILCGPGNNGGDGFVVARLLAQRGWMCTVSLYGDPRKLPPDAAQMYARWCALGEVIHWCDYEDPNAWRDATLTPDHDIFVDALFGIGLTRPLSGILEACSAYVAQNRLGSFARIVAIDVPSGLDADRGIILGHDPADDAVADMRRTGHSNSGFRAFAADLTVTVHRPKHGHVLKDGPWICGKRVVKDIGV